jgi:hypothetical protein
LQQRGLPSAGGTDDRNTFARHDCYVDAFQYLNSSGPFVETLDQPAAGEHRIASGMAYMFKLLSVNHSIFQCGQVDTATINRGATRWPDQ